MQDNNKETIDLQKDQQNDEAVTTPETEIEKPRAGMKIRTHIKAGGMVLCEDSEA